MRGFELTREKRDLYAGTLGRGPFPIQVIWGDRDPALRVGKHGEAVRRAAGVSEIIRLPGKHFLQEDQAPAIADHIARLVGH
jgi:pimeloyl-ACP methyl ester carboxylesterase